MGEGSCLSPVPRQRPDWLDRQEKISRDGEPRWRNQDGSRIYTYDRLHGHIEVFNRRGRHYGVADVRTGQLIGKAVPGRRIDV
ncbi:colicin E3/pyocin S6 family cytotoxin [Nocardia cerradoensis]|uniref:colicin E3/pyocin S6 family cytotoxin n=1 Tax=Nocardia cerradoensis TaxID=85688 RepID=UPI000B8B237C